MAQTFMSQTVGIERRVGVVDRVALAEADVDTQAGDLDGLLDRRGVAKSGDLVGTRHNMLEREAAVLVGRADIRRRRDKYRRAHRCVNVARDVVEPGLIERVGVAAEWRRRNIENGFLVAADDAYVVQHVLAAAEMNRLPRARK